VPVATVDPPPKVPPAAARQPVPRDRAVAPSPPEDLAAEAEGRSGRRASGLAEKESGVATSRFGEAEERRAAARSREGAFGRGQVREGKKASSQFS
jgi:hypothetical protein